MRSFSPPFSDLWATRPACLQIWGPLLLMNLKSTIPQPKTLRL